MLLFKKFAVWNSYDFVDFLKVREALLEVLEVFLLRETPLNLAGCSKTWKKLVECVCRIFHVLCPEVNLWAEDEFLLLRCKFLRE